MYVLISSPCEFTLRILVSFLNFFTLWLHFQNFGSGFGSFLHRNSMYSKPLTFVVFQLNKTFPVLACVYTISKILILHLNTQNDCWYSLTVVFWLSLLLNKICKWNCVSLELIVCIGCRIKKWSRLKRIWRVFLHTYFCYKRFSSWKG